MGSGGFGYYGGADPPYIAGRAEWLAGTDASGCGEGSNHFWAWIDTTGASDSPCINLATQPKAKINTYRYRTTWWATPGASSRWKFCSQYGNSKLQTLLPPINGGGSW